MEKLWVRVYCNKPAYVFVEIKEKENHDCKVGKFLLFGKVIHIFDEGFTTEQQGLKVGNNTYPDEDFCRKISVAEFIALKMTGEFYETSIPS